MSVARACSRAGEKLPERTFPAAFAHLDLQLLSQELADLPTHRIPHFGQIGRLVASRIGECDERRRREKKRRKCRSVFLELKRLRLASTAIVMPKPMRK